MDYNNQEAIVGATITLVGTKAKGSVSDNQGRFRLEVPSSTSRIQIQSLGYKPQTIRADECATIRLNPMTLELEDLVVTASRDAQKRSDVPAAISTLSPKRMEQYRPSRLDEVLNSVPGVYMSPLGGEQHMMSIRQPISTKSLFLYLEDGMPIRPTGNFNHNALLEMNMAITQSVEVLRGPASSIYGSEAVGGAINMITITPEGQFNGNITARVSDRGFYRSDVTLSGKNNKLGYALGGYVARQIDGVRDHSDMEKNAISLKLTYDLNDKTELWSTTSIIDYRADMSGSLDKENFESEEYSTLYTFTERLAKAFRQRLQIDHQWSTYSKTSVAFVYRNNISDQTPSYRIKNNRQDPLKATGEMNENHFQSYVFWLQHVQKLPALKSTLRIGGNIDYSPMTYFAERIDITRNEDGIYTSFTRPNVTLLDYETDINNKALYSQLDIRPLNKLKLVLGLRYDHFGYQFDNNLKAGDNISGDDNDHQSKITPRAGLTYDFGNDRILYANFSQGFIPPSVNEIYRKTAEKQNLNPARFNNYELGTWLKFLDGKASLDLSLYWMRGKDEIISVYDEVRGFINNNAGSTEHMGIEYGLSYKPFSLTEIRLSGNISKHKYLKYFEAKSNTEGQVIRSDFDDNDMPGAPSWVNNLSVTQKMPFYSNWTWLIEWQHVGPYYSDNANNSEYKGYDVFNLRSNCRFGRISVWAQLLNLTDKLYATRVSNSGWGEKYTPGAPRTFLVGIEYRFGGNR
ncbi:TonB-dependent receptor [Fulvitalea axinellae]|uniref:TonB-dependent receptor n=1 Tax=Fulvitalea axinellae TaxID=1182444 RepID=UPI0030CA1BBD